MTKEKKAKLIVGEWNTKTIVAVAIGAALYGVLMVYGGIPIFSNTQLSAAMIVPVIVGGLFGTLPAVVSCAVGNVLADLIGGWGMWFDWSIGNGVMAFFVAVLPLYGVRIKEGIFTVKQAVIYSVLCVVGNVVAFGLVTPVLSHFFYAADLNVTLLQALFASAGNSLVLIVVGIPLLLLLAKRYAAKTNLTEDTSEEY